ncbi:MAG: acyl-CoA dehydrogenase [Chloroflexi bacterium CFX4]|nr:acyl-CoA dehydrogenase [Chloroflexi bacterium CFX4]MDL1921262.1 acyl-CoA dehydrogenase [Chloroflexi bacterium CFX3]
MTISFAIPERVLQEREMLKGVAEGIMRPESRHLDEYEHERPHSFVKAMWYVLRDQQAKALQRLTEGGEKPKREGAGFTYVRMIILAEQLSWGDVGQYLCMPSPLLAGSAIEAVGTTEQKLRFLTRFAEGEPKWGAMAMTEPGAGSDTSAIQTTAVFDPETNEWILNGEKIFCTNGKLALEESDGVVVVWATVDRSAGRAGMKPFVVEAGTKGVKIGKVEIKHGIRASDTAAIVLDNARIPADNLLGSADVVQREGTAGFKGAMATFDASRPMVAASAIGVGRAALEFLKEKLAEHGIAIPYGAPYHSLSAVQRDVIEMEAQLKAAWLLTLRSASMLDHGAHNSLEASMAKVKAGKVVTQVTQKAVELLGTLGYSREWLVEKWMRDGKINDIYEGTGQINLLIVARRILGYTSRELQ